MHNTIERNLPELDVSMLDREEWWAFKENMHCVLDWVEVNPVALGHYRTMSEGRKADLKVLYSLMKMVMEDH